MRPTVIKETAPPEDASIAIHTIIDKNSEITVIVQNLTDKVMTIDQTKSFFIGTDKTSTAYYDPTVRYNTESKTEGIGKAGNFNLGGITNALGIGGALGSLMNATTIGQSQSTASTFSSTTIMSDLPQVSIGPKGKMAMSKIFKLNTSDPKTEPKEKLNMTLNDSDESCSIHIRYSLDDGETYETISSEFFSNACIYKTFYGKNRSTNGAVREILKLKPNMTLEPWFFLRTFHGLDNNRYSQLTLEDEIFRSQIFLNFQ